VNLLDNAIKYNRAGGRVGVAIGEAPDEVTLAVSDNGIGIPAIHLTRIFERFYRVDSGRAREEGGTGLGLAIVKHVAQVHGGRVEVESEVGAGSTFRVHLPRPA
jgi:two-component system phosphate regulon sensor histidine kinase PhoR